MANPIKLFKNEEPSGGPWPADIAKYYDKLDDKRGIPRAKLCRGYHITKDDRDGGADRAARRRDRVD